MSPLTPRRGDRHGPPIVRRLSALLSLKLTAWQTLVVTLLWLYVARNFAKLVGLECPEPLANLYSRAYFRATWVTTALDAGFWTAMRVRPRWLRDALSMACSVYYLFAAEQADQKVRNVRGMLTVDHLRVSWNKTETPYLKFITAVLRPRFMRYPPRAIRIHRPRTSAYRDPVQAWLYYEGPVADLKFQDKVVLDIPGGGFVAMNPRSHDDRLMALAGKTGLPILSLDYRKAPEYPYPYALTECYDVYYMLVASRGRCIGFSGNTAPRIVVSGDSAGGNLAVGMLLMALQAGTSDSRRWMGEQSLPMPESVILVYPALDVNIGNWMTDEQMSLINDRQHRKANRGVISRKSQDYKLLTPSTPHHSDDEGDDDEPSLRMRNDSVTTVVPATPDKSSVHPNAAHTSDASPTDTKSPTDPKPRTMKTRLAMSSMISYFNDRILTPEMMRAMIILYIGPHNRPDFSTDYLLSPLLAPDSLLARFPKTYLLTGERDPLVDDTVIFAGRLRQAKQARHLERQELGLERSGSTWNEKDAVEVTLVPAISHGFMQFPGVFPEAWKYILRCADWTLDSFERDDELDEDEDCQPGVEGEPDTLATDGHSRHESKGGRPAVRSRATWDARRRRRSRSLAGSSGDEDQPLEMTRVSPPPPPRANGNSKHDPTSKSSAAQVSPVVELNGRPIDLAAGGRSTERGGLRSGSLRGRRTVRRKSLVSLASEDDLLGRRMKGLAGGLMGLGEDDGPPTP
jgi:acetyl esterase/lipase